MVIKVLSLTFGFQAIIVATKIKNLLKEIRNFPILIKIDINYGNKTSADLYF